MAHKLMCCQVTRDPGGQPLEWRHMSFMASQTTSNSIVIQTAYLGSSKTILKPPIANPLWRETTGHLQKAGNAEMICMWHHYVLAMFDFLTLEIELTKATPYLVLLGELWGVFYE